MQKTDIKESLFTLLQYIETMLMIPSYSSSRHQVLISTQKKICSSKSFSILL